jgi:hypothetical protein
MTLDVDRILGEVAQQEGLDDFGDAPFRDGLDHLVRSWADEAQLNDIGRATAEGSVRGGLRNRLRVTDWHRQHPGLADTRVEAPIFVIGLPRTGTTALSHLLAADPANRSLLMWEGTDSVPPPTTATYATDPRFERARAQGLGLFELRPDLKAMHYDPPEAPVECSVLLGQCFASPSISTLYNVPSYDDWMLGLDVDWPAVYAYHRSVLQVLQSEHPGRWQLKAPAHGLAMEAIGATYPDARFVMTHRDPARAVASVCSLVNGLSGVFSDADHRDYIAGHWPELLGTIVDRILDFRDAHGDDAFFDVDHRALVDDPIGSVAAIYDHFGIALSAAAERGLRGWSSAHPAGEHGVHRYSLAEFGLTRGPLDDRFARYLDRFDIELEDA